MTSTPTTAAADYPLRFDVEYPAEPRNRLTVAFRIIVALPILIVIGLLEPSSFSTDDGSDGVALAGGAIFFPTLLMLLFRQKYPRWWFDFNREITRFGARVGAYVGLLRDEYPSTDEEQAVRLEIDYPDATDLNRWLPLVKWLLLLPHYIVLLFLFIAAVFVTLFAWFAILITGRYPRGLFEFSVGVSRWLYRVTTYGFLLVTDKYPPFSLK